MSLEEDFIIIDSVVEKLKAQDDKLGELTVESKNLEQVVGRHPNTVYHRWERYLKVWLLGYYRKTLNMEIRMMLANCLADNFKDIDSIDWDFVSKFSEFQGHTIISLKRVFFLMFLQCASHLNTDKTQVSLKLLAEYANVTFGAGKARKLLAKVKIRQMKVIEYFESQVKKFGIKDFL